MRACWYLFWGIEGFLLFYCVIAFVRGVVYGWPKKKKHYELYEILGERAKFEHDLIMKDRFNA